MHRCTDKSQQIRNGVRVSTRLQLLDAHEALLELASLLQDETFELR